MLSAEPRLELTSRASGVWLTEQQQAQRAMVAWVRSGVLEGAPELIAELGEDPGRIARACGIDRAAFADPDFPIPTTAVVTYLEEAARVCRCETFGLQLSKRQELSLFGPLWPLFQSAPTVGTLLKDLVDFFPLHTKGALVSLAPAPGGVLGVYELAAGIATSRRQVVELGIGILVAELQRWAPDWRPSEVYFRHNPPKNPALHRKIFGRGVSFNADRNAVFVEAAILSRPNPARDTTLHARMTSRLEKQRKALAGDIGVRTEIVVRSLLPFAPCDLQVTARFLRLAPRTLQRRLAEDATSFAAIVDHVRADLAMSYLRDSDLSVAQVAEILQFSETSALSRAFSRWYGKSPRRVRAQETRSARAK